MSGHEEIIQLINTVKEGVYREFNCVHARLTTIEKKLPPAIQAIKWGSLGGGIVASIALLTSRFLS